MTPATPSLKSSAGLMTWERFTRKIRRRTASWNLIKQHLSDPVTESVDLHRVVFYNAIP